MGISWWLIRSVCHHEDGYICWAFLNLIDGQVDLAEAVGADLSVMERDARRMRYVYSPDAKRKNCIAF